MLSENRPRINQRFSSCWLPFLRYAPPPISSHRPVWLGLGAGGGTGEVMDFHCREAMKPATFGHCANCLVWDCFDSGLVRTKTRRFPVILVSKEFDWVCFRAFRLASVARHTARASLSARETRALSTWGVRAPLGFSRRGSGGCERLGGGGHLKLERLAIESGGFDELLRTICRGVFATIDQLSASLVVVR